MITATRYHDISCGHRVCGHESKCAHLHGHNYRVHFTVCPVDRLDDLGRVLDFSAIKDRLCLWLEEQWDHRFLLHTKDPFAEALMGIDPHGLVLVPFNPTAENMADYLLNTIGPLQLRGTDCQLIQVRIEETRKCSADATLNGVDHDIR
jgi:6-pyruvoyltetrahydropterin/6-carboxytetrahydropterin synthase